MRAQLMELTAGQPQPVAEGEVVEHRLHQRLAVVERALDGDGMHVGLATPSSSCAAARRRCGPAGTARRHRRARSRGRPRSPRRRCRPRSPPTMVDALAARGQHPVHQAGQQLHGHVLEGQRRPVEQLQHPQAAVDLHQRRDGGVAEAGIGVAGNRQQLAARDRAAGERLQQRGGDLGEGPAGKGRDGLAATAWARSSAHRARRRAPGPPAARPRRPARALRLWC